MNGGVIVLYSIVFPFVDGSETVKCKSIKGYKPLIMEYLKRHNGDIVRVYRGKKLYCSYAMVDGVMVRMGV